MKIKTIVSVLFLIAALEAANASITAAPQRGDGERRRADAWWLDQSIAMRMGLSKQQIDRIDAIYRSPNANDSALLKDLVAQREQLEALLQKADAEESVVFAAIDRVEHLRYQINRNRALMLYRMRRCLTSEQRALLAKIAGERRPAKRPSGR